ncbi:hypothetical protein AC578_8544 [Pseudocercospora eumusae]|uniref:Uncharacterized protein n=1 Tax=Pseudocercospora eumusae TaxID=321146 RepID=A0A139HW61_9PEZI|nr:hypothetical protein AC578_8544 [Pseudocercospora eumusae]
MDGHTGYSHVPSTLTDPDPYNVKGLWRIEQIESPDDPTAANGLFRMADDLPLYHPAFRSDIEQFEHFFEQCDGIVDPEWDPYQATSQDRRQRDQEMTLKTNGSLPNSLAPHVSIDRHDSVVTRDGQYEKRAAAPSDDWTTAQTFTGAQSMPCEDLISEIQQHLFGRHIDESNDQHISGAEWQFYEAGVEELRSSQMPEAVVEPSYIDASQPDYGSVSPPYTHWHDQVVGSDLPQAPMTGDFPEPFDAGYEYTISNPHGNHTYHPSAPLQLHGSQAAFQEGSGKYAYPNPYKGEYGPAPSAAQDQTQAIVPRNLLSEEQKVHLVELVQSNQVAYGAQVNAMILNHEIDYYPPIPLVAFPKQQERPSIDHGLLSTDEILSGAVHPEQMFGGLLLRLCKSYSNKDLGAKINALYGKNLQPSTYAHRISDAVNAFARREGTSAEPFRALLKVEPVSY